MISDMFFNLKSARFAIVQGMISIFSFWENKKIVKVSVGYSEVLFFFFPFCNYETLEYMLQQNKVQK
jgi:hypothetical protein